MAPRTDDERAEVVNLVRAAIEKQHRFPAPMKGVCDLLDMMTPENAYLIQDAFLASWEDGYNYNWERSVFFSRDGEVMGAEGAKEFYDHDEFARLLVSWSTVEPAESVEWINGMDPGPRQLEAVRQVLVGAGRADRNYGRQIFESLAPNDRVAMQGEFFNDC